MIPKLRDISYEMHKKMWYRFNNTRVQEIERSDRKCLKILNGYENIDRNIFSGLRKREELGNMEVH